MIAIRIWPSSRQGTEGWTSEMESICTKSVLSATLGSTLYEVQVPTPRPKIHLANNQNELGFRKPRKEVINLVEMSLRLIKQVAPGAKVGAQKLHKLPPRPCRRNSWVRPAASSDQGWDESNTLSTGKSSLAYQAASR
jgi:hypothetical protein